MKETAAHTPTPWRKHDMEDDAIVGPDRKAIAMVWGKSRDPEEDAANLAHIVRCVNSHDALIAALESCDKAFANWQLGQIPGRHEDILNLLNTVRATLNETKGPTA